MKTCTIVGGIWKKEEINGTYELIQKFHNYPSKAKDGRVKVSIDGATACIRVNEEDVTYDGDTPVTSQVAAAVIAALPLETDSEMEERIQKRFRVMGKMAKGAIAQRITSFIISGAPGVGKTFELEQQLEAAADNGDIVYDSIKGKTSAIGLYMRLWEMKEPGSILLLDDIDVFGNEDVLNILKAALDTGEKRIVSWNTASAFLEDAGIDTQFEFEGTVIFITNSDLDHEIAKGNKMSPHVDALISRSIYVDLGVHAKREILCRVKHVVNNTDMLQKLGLDDNQVTMLMDWVIDNLDELRNISIRTMLHLTNIYLADPIDWIEDAEVVLFKPKARRV